MNFAKGNRWMSGKKYTEEDGSDTRMYLVAWTVREEERSSSKWVCPSSRPTSSSTLLCTVEIQT